MTDAELDALDEKARTNIKTNFEKEGYICVGWMQDVVALVAALREARAVLKSVEWGGNDSPTGEQTCPDCGAYANMREVDGRWVWGAPEPHKPGCRLAAVLGSPRRDEDPAAG